MLNVNSIYAAQGVDINNVAKVSGEILKGARDNTPKVQTIDYSKFNRAVLGIDLYSSRTNTDVQKQIALTQAGLYSKAVDVSRLNSQAAMALYSASAVQKNVEMAQSVQDIELVAPKQIKEETSKVQLFNIFDKNSRSSNGFNPFYEEDNESNKNESEKEKVNLFA